MSNFAPSYLTVNPHYMVPEFLMQYSQPSGAFNLLGGSSFQTKLTESDLYVYAKTMQLTTQVQVGQSSITNLPSASVFVEHINMPTYRISTRSQYDGFDEAAASTWGYALNDANRLAARQGINQCLRNVLLYGVNPSNYEGLVNTAGVTKTTLPTDSNGNVGYANWDSGQLAMYLSNLIGTIHTNTYQMGIPLRIEVLGPQRFFQALTFDGLVNLVQFQREGGGVETAAGLVSTIVDWSAGDSLNYSVDDTLINQGTGGNTDLIIITAPEIKVSGRGMDINTNIFASLTPNILSTNVMFSDMPAPKEIPTPIADGGITTMYTMRVTPGWAWRPEATIILSAAYT